MPGSLDARDAEAGIRDGFPLGAAVAMDELDGELHPLLRRLREHEPVSWPPVLGGWLVPRRDLALQGLRGTPAFTGHAPRLSNPRRVGPGRPPRAGAPAKRH